MRIAALVAAVLTLWAAGAAGGRRDFTQVANGFDSLVT